MFIENPLEKRLIGVCVIRLIRYDVEDSVQRDALISRDSHGPLNQSDSNNVVIQLLGIITDSVVQITNPLIGEVERI